MVDSILGIVYHVGMFNLTHFQDVIEASGKSQAQIARDLGVNPSLINAYTQGLKAPKAIQLCRILQACGYDLNEQRLTDWYTLTTP